MNKSTNKIICYSDNPTVVKKYQEKNTYNNYLSESELENQFVNQLISQGYEYLDLTKFSDNHEKILIDNLKTKLEKLNNFKFSSEQWEKICNEYILKKDETLLDKTEKIQKDYIFTLNDNNENINIKLIDKENIQNNYLQVIRQYKTKNEKYSNRYDVTILVNGLPLIQIELKRSSVPIKEAFNQINRYKNESYSGSKGLFNYIQIFIVSNGNETKYFSNTINPLKFDKDSNNTTNKSNSDKSFEFTIYWSDQENNLIKDIEDFTKHFLSKHTILNVLTKYCIFTVNKQLLIMRPYQIVATEKIINKIQISENYQDTLGTNKSGGFIWHTTGSGKTVTSFKTAQIAKNLSFVKKVLFVVDRQDLDYQTMKEYDKLEKDAANSNKTTKILQKQLEDPNCKIIITTIQKLANFTKNNDKHPIYKEHNVLIFDECHRSQFGEMNNLIRNKFKNSNLFGFTGTPIFADNSQTFNNPYNIACKEIKNKNNENKITYITTNQLFGDCLHKYTIINAINDKNVLPFRYSEIGKISKKNNIADKPVLDIDTNSVWENPERITKIVEYILNNFDKQTHRDMDYEYSTIKNIIEVVKDKNRQNPVNRINKVVKGFNSIFAVSSIEIAKLYYKEFKKQLEILNRNDLNIAIIFSPYENEELNDIDNSRDFNSVVYSIDEMDKNSKEFLINAIDDYNKMFNSNYNISSFENYYRDVSLRMKNMELDILIVVNMFLTGFDAKTLNTLWIDKNLKTHTLFQAISRTNRIFNSCKQYGNIVSFRPLENEINEALKLFSDNNKNWIKCLKTFDEYWSEYSKKTQKLLNDFPLEKELSNFKDKKSFCNLFGQILKLKNNLNSFENFKNDYSNEIKKYLDKYLAIYNQIKTNKNKLNKEPINEDIVFEIDILKEIDINLDYIFFIIERDYKNNNLSKDEKYNKSKNDIINSLNLSYEWRSKKELIIKFIDSLYDNVKTNLDVPIQEEFKNFIRKEQQKQLNEIIEKHNLYHKQKQVTEYMNNSFEIGEFRQFGKEYTDIVGLVGNLFNKNNNDELKNELKEHFEHFKEFF